MANDPVAATGLPQDHDCEMEGCEAVRAFDESQSEHVARARLNAEGRAAPTDDKAAYEPDPHGFDLPDAPATREVASVEECGYCHWGFDSFEPGCAQCSRGGTYYLAREAWRREHSAAKSYIEWHVETMALYAEHGIALPTQPPKVIYPGTSVIAPDCVVQVPV